MLLTVGKGIKGGCDYDGRGVDVWTLGVLYFEMVTGDTLFAAKDQQKVFQKILAGKWKLPEDISKEGCDLLSKVVFPFTIQICATHQSR